MSFFSLNLISMVLVLLLAGFFSTQGTFSTLLTLVMALFAAILAMGMGGAAAGIMPSSLYEYAQGIGFLGTFVVTFIALRVAADMLIPKNVPLPRWPDKIAAGAVGLLTGLVLIGALVVGLEMLPFGTAILGNGTIVDGQVVDRTLAGRFVAGMFYLTNGGSMGGTALASEHPDLEGELAMKRHTLWAELRQTLSPDLITVPAAFQEAQDKLAEQNISIKKTYDSDKILIIRTEVLKSAPGAKLDVTKPNAETSFDVGDNGYFDVTAAQVRMVTKSKDGQYQEFNPIGFLDHGGKNSPQRKAKQVTFAPLSLDTGIIAEDYTETESEFKAIIEWVFEIPDDAVPQFIEVKRGGVVSLLPSKKSDDPTGPPTEVIASDKAYTSLPADLYPPRDDRSHQCALTIKVTEDGKPKRDATVWIVGPTVTKHVVASILADPIHFVEVNANPESADPWPDPAPAGVPGRTDLLFANRTSTDRVANKGPTDTLDWADVIQVLYYGNSARSVGQTVDRLKSFFNGPFSDALDSAEMAQSRFDKYKTDAKGTHAPTMVKPGDVYIIVVSEGAKSIRIWVIKQPIASTNDKLTIDLPADKQPNFETNAGTP